MFEWPWWVWAIAAVVGLPLMGFLAALLLGAAHERGVRRDFETYLQDVDPDIHVERSGGRLRLTSGGASKEVPLDPLYVACRGQHAWAGRVNAFSRFFGQEGSESGDLWPRLSLEKHGPRLMPVLQRQEDVPPSVDAPVRNVDDTGLLVTYVLDGKKTVLPIDTARRKQLGLSDDELHERVLANLSAITIDEPLDGVLKNGEPSAIQLNEHYNASRILVYQRRLPPTAKVAAIVTDTQALVLLPVPETDDDWNVLVAACAWPVGQGFPLLERPLLIAADRIAVVEPTETAVSPDA
jgi:hypothetical protein